MKQPHTTQKLVKLKSLLQNSKFKTLSNSDEILNSASNLESLKNDFLVPTSNSQKEGRKATCFLKQGIDFSKNFSLFFSLIEKPVNLLFSIDQFVFEFSKKTYQQKKTGEFFQQLKERKKLSLFYGNLPRKQISNFFHKVKKTKGYFFKNVFSLLERRLDVVLYRSGLTKTIAEARQLIKHKKILVNEKRIHVPSFLVNSGDLISLTSKTENVLTHRLMESLNTKTLKNDLRIVGDFYSKLKKTLDSLLNKSKKSPTLLKKKIFERPCSVETFKSKKLCKFFIQLLCVKIKSRSFWNLKKQKVNQINLQNLSESMVKNGKNSVIAMFKWKSFSHSQKKSSFSRKFKEKGSHLFVPLYRKQNQEKSFYANQACLQKEPVFWNRNLASFKQKKKILFQNSGTPLSFTHQSSRPLVDKKNVKFLNTKSKSLQLYRKSFLIFLKLLENSPKFTGLVSLTVKKFLVKCSASKQKSTTRFGFAKKNVLRLPQFSKNLGFRGVRPLNVEISYNLLNVIYLYSPQRVNFPFHIDVELIQRSLR